jgi:hypothetical protein
MNEDESVKLVQLDPGQEFAEIEQSFRRSMGRTAAIQSIRRIQNAELWEGFRGYVKI